MLTPGVFTGLAIFWVLACGLVLWLVWRAVRSEASAPPRREKSEEPGRSGRPTDRAA